MCKLQSNKGEEFKIKARGEYIYIYSKSIFKKAIIAKRVHVPIEQQFIISMPYRINSYFK